jgi:hypothetical protein
MKRVPGEPREIAQLLSILDQASVWGQILIFARVPALISAHAKIKI